MRLARILISLTALSMPLFGADPDPFFGKWLLNWAKSHSPQPQPKSAIRKYQKSGNGVRVQETWIDAGGKKMSLDYVAGYDGNEYPVRTVKGATVAFTRPDRFTVHGISRRDGKVVYTFKRTVSPDGATLTVELTRATEDGNSTTEALVYDKLK